MLPWHFLPEQLRCLQRYYLQGQFWYARSWVCHLRRSELACVFHVSWVLVPPVSCLHYRSAISSVWLVSLVMVMACLPAATQCIGNGYSHKQLKMYLKKWTHFSIFSPYSKRKSSLIIYFFSTYCYNAININNKKILIYSPVYCSDFQSQN